MHLLPSSWDDLPTTDSSVVREGYSLEFKQRVDPRNRGELAKDVALLANTYGGLLLIGATETASGVDYCGIAAGLGRDIAEAYVCAVRDFCSPRPILVPREIVNPTRRDNVVVGVAVEPFPDQPIGVAQPDCHGRPSDGWRFPVRVNRHTIFLKAEQLMLWFNPHTRRTAIALSEIAEGRTVDLCCESGASSAALVHEPATLVRWSALENYVELKPGRSGFDQFRAPLEDVVSVWKSTDERWALRLRGRYVRGPQQGFVYEVGA